MKYISIGFLVGVSFSLGAMDRGEVTELLVRKAFELAVLCNQLQDPKDSVEIPELSRTYFKAFGRQPFARVEPKPPCIFCYKLGKSEEEFAALPEDHPDKYAIVKKFDKGTVLFANQMPYADGHCLVIPEDHVRQLRQLSREQRTEYHGVVDCAVPIFMKVFRTPGFNVGVNDGEWGGASVAEHVHTHLIPRGRDGFNRTVTNTALMTLSVKDVYDRLKKPMDRLQAALREGQETSDIDIDSIIAPDDKEDMS